MAIGRISLQRAVHTPELQGGGGGGRVTVRNPGTSPPNPRAKHGVLSWPAYLSPLTASHSHFSQVYTTRAVLTLSQRRFAHARRPFSVPSGSLRHTHAASLATPGTHYIISRVHCQYRWPIARLVRPYSIGLPHHQPPLLYGLRSIATLCPSYGRSPPRFIAT
jgi:hypothetical protein